MWSDSIVFFGTDDLEETHTFYTQSLHLTLEKDQGLCRIYRVNGGGCLGFCSHLPVVHLERSPIITLIIDDVDSLYNRLKKEGCRVLHPPKENPTFSIYHFFLKDPSGYLVEIQRFLS